MMNNLEFMLYFLNMLIACSALPVEERQIDGLNYRVQGWECRVDQGPVFVRAWSRPCQGGQYTYWGRTFYVKFEGLGEEAWYINRFGEVQGGPGAQLGDAYQPPCGS